MATITSSLERSLRNCSLNAPDSPDNSQSDSTAQIEISSQISLPYHWEQCLDLKTGEVYYVNWKTGLRAKEDPRTSGDFYSEDDRSYDDSEESSSEYSPDSYSRDHQIYHQPRHNDNNNNTDDKSGVDIYKRENVLVVAGCKRCLMYFMVPKQDPNCPKCGGQLLQFDDQSENGCV